MVLSSSSSLSPSVQFHCAACHSWTFTAPFSPMERDGRTCCVCCLPLWIHLTSDTSGTLWLQCPGQWSISCCCRGQQLRNVGCSRRAFALWKMGQPISWQRYCSRTKGLTPMSLWQCCSGERSQPSSPGCDTYVKEVWKMHLETWAACMNCIPYYCVRSEIHIVYHGIMGSWLEIMSVVT